MRLVIALPYAWLVVFFLLPFAVVLAIALGTQAPDQAPPVALGLSFANFALLFTDDLYLAAWLSSLRIAATAPAHVGDPAVLDVVSDPRLRLDRTAVRQRPDRPIPALDRARAQSRLD